VVACRALGYPELAGDLAVGEAAGDEHHYLSLALGQVAHRFVSGREILRDRGFGVIRLLRVNILGGYFERHGSPLGQPFFPCRLPQPGTRCSQVRLVQRPLGGGKATPMTSRAVSAAPHRRAARMSSFTAPARPAIPSKVLMTLGFVLAC
jgi:hypothetical protein